MSEPRRPLLLFPKPTTSEREKRPPFRPQLRVPSAPRQVERLTPIFSTLQTAFDARRLQLSGNAPTDDPELVVVLETVGSIEKFIGAVKRTPGLEWLLEADKAGIEPDDDFYDIRDRQNSLSGRVYLLGSNQRALAEVINLWNRYKQDPHVNLERGLAKWKDVFNCLKDVRFWNTRDRIGQDIREYWESRLAIGEEAIRFEIEAWCYSSLEKNRRAAEDLARLVSKIGGRILNMALIQDIAYHGFLVEMPASGVSSLLSETPPDLVLSDSVMLFRPRGQAMPPTPNNDDLRVSGVNGSSEIASGPPIVAILDGLPLQNHPLLAGRLIVDDPDGWEANYQASERVHGTAMASLVVCGELDGPAVPLSKPVYVRPIMRPDSADFNSPRRESTPNDILLIDLIHRSVKRIFDGDGAISGAAPSVKIINLSVGEPLKPFDTDLSPWARLLDWLSVKYQVLFVLSAGNTQIPLTPQVPRGTFSSKSREERQRLAETALMNDSVSRRMLSPGEAINAITVGSLHADKSAVALTLGRFDIFPEFGISPYSRIGLGFRRSVKPEILIPGGRLLYRESSSGRANVTELQAINTSLAPGQMVAAPPNSSGSNTRYTRGTSNATALATRGAARAHAIIESLRSESPGRLPDHFDAVLLKALLVHGAEWGNLATQIVNARPDVTDWRRRKGLVTRFVGYGRADIDRAITCTEERATLLGIGKLKDGEAHEFRVPLPPSLNAKLLKRRLTLTLAWMSPVYPRHARYRAARVWVNLPDTDFGVSRINCDWRDVQRGTVQHEILEGESAIPFVEGTDLVFKVNCAEDGGKLTEPVLFALCVTIEIAPGLGIPIYKEIQERVSERVKVQG